MDLALNAKANGNLAGSLKPYNAEKPQEWQNDRIRDVLSLSPRSSDTRIVYVCLPTAKCQIFGKTDTYVSSLIELQDRLRSYQYSKSDELTLLETIFDWLSESKGTTPLLLTKATKRCQRSFDVLSSVLASSTLHIFHMRDARKSHGVKVDGTTIRTYYKFCSPFGPVLRPRYPYSESICCAVGQVINLEETDAFGICSSVVVQSGAEDVTLSFEDVIKYAATVDNSPVGRSLALMATCAHRSYQAWDSYIATSEKFARLLVRGLQIYPGEDCANNDKQWINSTKDKAWTMDDLEILGQSLTQLEQRLQYTKQSLYQNVQTTRFISRKVLAEISHQSERHVSPSDIPETVSKVRDELGRFDELHARLPSLEVSLDRTEKLFRNLQQLALVRNSFNALKLEYISQNYIRVAAFMTILFLPGIFVSVRAHVSLEFMIRD